MGVAWYRESEPKDSEHDIHSSGKSDPMGISKAFIGSGGSAKDVTGRVGEEHVHLKGRPSMGPGT